MDHSSLPLLSLAHTAYPNRTNASYLVSFIATKRSPSPAPSQPQTLSSAPESFIAHPSLRAQSFATLCASYSNRTVLFAAFVKRLCLVRSSVAQQGYYSSYCSHPPARSASAALS
eukprot:TRINITY_DN52470_c0_g1_i1.p1 TRINITY_DN52470_c0_g1~~TRINITY_DN52470_c0_g1_i1.p1  ORF type:complete len:115 (+),score=15.76 TRINITY_DN52470_c0_g1_i1:169-513(+)